MKIKTRDQTRFLANTLPPEIIAVILYGPNSGRVSEEGEALKNRLVADDDPFSYVPLKSDDLKEDPGRLTDELASGSLMGGVRLIHIKCPPSSSGAKVADALKSALKVVETPQNRILIEAGGLSPRSALRKFGEKSKQVAILPFYEDDMRTLQSYISDLLRAEKLKIDRDAALLLIESVGSERILLRRAIEKIITYKQNDDGQMTVTLADIMACEVPQDRLTLDRLVQATADNRMADIDRALEALISENIAYVSILRAVQRYLYRLREAHALVGSGQSVDQAMQSLRPPVFFKQKDAFRRHLRRWSISQIDDGLSHLMAAEVKAKQSGQPIALFVHRTLVRIGA